MFACSKPSATRRTAASPLALAALVAALAGLSGCHPEASSSAWGHNKQAMASGGSTAVVPGAAKASFKGTSGTARVSGRELRAEDGRLSLDGKPYGTVDARSENQLLVRDGNTMVTVNGLVRYPDTRS